MNDAEKTARAFVKNPSCPVRRAHLSDRRPGRMLPRGDGVPGPQDHQVKIRGLSAWNWARSRPAAEASPIRAAVVVDREDGERQKYLVRLRGRARSITLATVRDHLAQSLPVT